MGKRSMCSDAGCTTACVDIDQLRARKGVLCAIENMATSPKRPLDHAKSPSAKKQRCLELGPGADGTARLDVSCLFVQARNVLRQPPSGAVEPPIGREEHDQVLVKEVDDFVASGVGKSVYVSGLPGTGKSHTVRKVLQRLVTTQPQAASITWINCMTVSAAGQVYGQIAATAAGDSNFCPLEDSRLSQDPCSDSDLDSTCHVQLDLDPAIECSTAEVCNSGQATFQQLVDKLSTPSSSSMTSNISRQTRPSTTSASSSRPTPRRKAVRTNKAQSSATPSRHIIVLDEIDNLIHRNQADLVQMFLLPHQPGVHVLVIGIANSIDLTERMLPELKLRRCSPRLICFPAYTAKQLTNILTSCLDELPCKLFETSALELCSRSVATSSGDIRHALKACRAAVDELERQQQKHAATGEVIKPSPKVNVRSMMNALASLASSRSSHYGAQATSSIRTLPNQQQLLLYAMSVLCRPRDSVCDDTRISDSKKDSSSLWAAAGTASALSSSCASGNKSSKGSSTTATPGSTRQVFTLAVGIEEAYAQYKQVCNLLALPPCSRAELQHMAELLSQMALVDVIRPAAGTGGSAARSTGTPTGLQGFGRRTKGLGGLGGGKALSKAVSAAVGGQQQDIKLSLKPSVDEVHAALRHNPALRCLVDK